MGKNRKDHWLDVVPSCWLNKADGQLTVHYPPKNCFKRCFDELRGFDSTWPEKHNVTLRRAFPDYESACNKLQRARKKIDDSLSSTTEVEEYGFLETRSQREKSKKNNGTENIIDTQESFSANRTVSSRTERRSNWSPTGNRDESLDVPQFRKNVETGTFKDFLY